MSIDLSQFFDVFFEESVEGLDAMESHLLTLTPGDVDGEILNTIFRAAHSIKGGSGTFGFTAVAEFTHVLETLLDQIRQGQRALTREHVDLLLQAVDCLRAMLDSLQSGTEVDPTQAHELQQQFEAILADSVSSHINVQEQESAPTSAPSQHTYQIHFKPHAHLFKTGNEPLYMLSDVAELGQCDVSACLDDIPDITELDCETCYLSWQLTLQSQADKSALSEIFEWVEDDADIRIESKQPTATEAAPSNEQSSTSAPAPSPAANARPPQSQAPQGESSSIRVGVDKVDSLINMVGELVITQSMLTQFTQQELNEQNLQALQEGLAQLAHNTRDLQESVMRIRMLPISFVFNRFVRLVRDTSQKLNKDIQLDIRGEHTELDKTVMEKIADPLVHLVRNSMDHGLETPLEREQAGKPATGTITLNAYHQGGHIVIEITDDGRGLNGEKIKAKAIEKGLISEESELSDEQIYALIFEPGFSTADTVTDISGRGVGMDVVRKNIEQLSGAIEVNSKPNKGATFKIRLPLTLAILDGQLVQVGDQTYIIPLVSIIESLQINPAKVSKVGKGIEVLQLREHYIPIVRLYKVFNIDGAQSSLDKALLVVLESDNQKMGLLVDDLLAQQQVVVKSLETNYQKVDGISGATILGSGQVSLILDVAGLVKLSGLLKPGVQEAIPAPLTQEPEAL